MLCSIFIGDWTLAVEHFTFCVVEACPAEGTSDSNLAEVAGGCRAGSCLQIAAVFVQANTLDKGGGERESRRHGVKKHWIF